MTRIDFAKRREQPPTGVMSVGGGDLQEPLPILSWHFQFDAMKATCMLLDQFEERSFLAINSELLNCIGLWFLTLESAISAVFKIAASPLDVEKYKTFPQKFRHLEKLLGGVGQPPKLMCAEVEEFCAFRNQIFHDLYYPSSKIIFMKTKFCKIPAYANEIDMMEAARVCVNSVGYYRRVLLGVSLFENNSDAKKFYQIDMVPRFEKLLDKKGFYPVPLRPLDDLECPVFTKAIYSPFIKL